MPTHSDTIVRPYAVCNPNFSSEHLAYPLRHLGDWSLEEVETQQHTLYPGRHHCFERVPAVCSVRISED